MTLYTLLEAFAPTAFSKHIIRIYLFSIQPLPLSCNNGGNRANSQHPSIGPPASSSARCGAVRWCGGWQLFHLPDGQKSVSCAFAALRVLRVLGVLGGGQSLQRLKRVDAAEDRVFPCPSLPFSALPLPHAPSLGNNTSDDPFNTSILS